MTPLRAERIRWWKSLSVALPLAAALALAGCEPERSDPRPPPLTVPELLERFTASYQAKDARAIAGMCRFPFELDGVPLEDAAQLRELLGNLFEEAGTYEAVELLEPEIAEAGDAVTVTGTLRVVDSLHGESNTPFTIEALREDGSWKATRFVRG